MTKEVTNRFIIQLTVPPFFSAITQSFSSTVATLQTILLLRSSCCDSLKTGSQTLDLKFVTFPTKFYSPSEHNSDLFKQKDTFSLNKIPAPIFSIHSIPCTFRLGPPFLENHFEMLGLVFLLSHLFLNTHHPSPISKPEPPPPQTRKPQFSAQGQEELPRLLSSSVPLRGRFLPTSWWLTLLPSCSLEGNCIRLDNGHVSQSTGCLPSPTDTACGCRDKEFNKPNFLLPISCVAETKGKKVAFFLSALGYFFRTEEKSDKSNESALQYKSFPVVHWPLQWSSFLL